MNTFELRIFDDEASLCSFYTVLQDEHTLSETDKFFSKYRKDERLKGSLQELAKFLEIVVGEEYGALPEFFKFENTAQALPPTGNYRVEQLTIRYSNFPLRLYCLRLSDSLVVLFNGAEKTSRTAQAGKTSLVFTEANQFAARILDALYCGEVSISGNGRRFKNEEGGDEIVL